MRHLILSWIILRVTIHHLNLYVYFCCTYSNIIHFSIIFHLLGNSTIPVIRVYPSCQSWKHCFFNPKHLEQPAEQVESTPARGHRELSSTGFPITKQWGGLFLFQALCLWAWLKQRTKTTHCELVYVMHILRIRVCRSFVLRSSFFLFPSRYLLMHLIY